MKTTYKKLPSVDSSKYKFDESLDGKSKQIVLSPELQQQQDKLVAIVRKGLLTTG